MTTPPLPRDSGADRSVDGSVVGIVFPSPADNIFIDSEYYRALLQGVAEMVSSSGQQLLVWACPDGTESVRFLERVLGGGVCDGYIIASVAGHSLLPESAFAPFLSRGVPFVMVERPNSDHGAISYVTIDNFLGARLATEHLINLGRRRIGHLSAGLDISDGRDRLAGYRLALQAAGLPIDDALICDSDFTEHAGYESASRLLHEQPDALFACSDVIAIGAMHAIQDAGLRVGDDIAVVGFDDLEGAARSQPSLSTIRQPVRQKGASAVALLNSLLSGRATGPRQVILPTQLVIRQSSGANLSSEIGG